MPLTRRQAEQQARVGVCLTLDDVAKKLTRVSGSIHSVANYVNEAIENRPGFFAKFRRSGENSSANARALWRFHDRRWEKKEGTDDDDEDEDDEEDEGIDEEVDRRIGQPFSFSRAVEVTIELLSHAKDVLSERKAEMEAWSDNDGAVLLEAFIEAYGREIENWGVIKDHLGMCSTYMGESILDTSLRHGWL